MGARLLSEPSSGNGYHPQWHFGGNQRSDRHPADFGSLLWISRCMSIYSYLIRYAPFADLDSTCWQERLSIPGFSSFFIWRLWQCVLCMISPEHKVCGESEEPLITALRIITGIDRFQRCCCFPPLPFLSLTTSDQGFPRHRTTVQSHHPF